MCKKQRKPSRALVVSNLAKKRVSGFLAGVLLVGGLLTPTYRAEAHTGYFLSIIPDINNLGYQSLVVEDGPMQERDHLEFQFINGKYAFFEKEEVRLKETLDEYVSNVHEITGLEGSIGDLKIKGDTQCMFTFPTCSTNGNWWDAVSGVSNAVTSFIKKGEGNGAALDRDAANKVGQQLTQAANTALSYITRTASSKNWTYGSLSRAEKEEKFIEITSKLANASREAAGNKRVNFTIQSTTYTVHLLSESEKASKGLTSDEAKRDKYLNIKANNDPTDGVVYQYSTPRYPNAPEQSKIRGISQTITLYNIIALGNTSYVYGNVETTSLEAVYNPNWIEEILIGALNMLLEGARSLLGLNTMGELMFNDGSYGTNTYKGIAPVSWFQAADVLFWVSQVFAWLLLAFASLKFLGMHMWSTITPMNRVSLMNGIQNILITAFLLSMIVPIFNVVAEFNFLIVGVLRDASMFNDNLVNGHAFPPTLAGVVLGLIFFLAEIVINFMYILRGATVAILYGLSPVFVVAFAFGGRFQGITLKFIKEIIGNIFIQTFHAVILTFYGLFMFTGGTGGFFVKLVMIFAFIPMTKVFKEITGIGESGFIQGVAEQAKGTVQNVGKKAYNGAKGAGDALVGDKLDSMVKGPKDKGVSPTVSGDGNGASSGGFKTSTYERETSALNSAQNNRSISESMAPNTATTTTGSTTETSNETTSSGTNTPSINEASFGSSGGSSNEFGRADFGSSDKTASASGLKASLNYAKGVGKLGAGMALGALGGATGNKFLQKAGRATAASGVNSWKDGRQISQNNAEYKGANKRPHLSSVETDFDLNNKASAKLHTYNGAAAKDAGIVHMSQELVDGKQCLIQEFSADAVKNMPNLHGIEFDAETGRVTNEAALSAGITHMSKMDNGNYRVALDMQKSDIKGFRSMGGGSRYEVKTGVDSGRLDMNYTAAALERMHNPSKTPTSSSSDSTSKVS